MPRSEKNPVIFIDIMALIEASFLTKTLNDALARPTLSYPKSTRTGRSIIDDIITMKNNGATIIIFSNCPDTRQANILGKIFGDDFQGYIRGKQNEKTRAGIYLQTFTSAHLAEGSNTVDNYDNLFGLELKHRSARGPDSSYRQILGTELRNQLSNKYQHLRPATLGNLNEWVTRILQTETQQLAQAEETSAVEPAALTVAATAPAAGDTRITADTDEAYSHFEFPEPPTALISERIKIIIHFSAENTQGSGNVFSFTTARPGSIGDLHIAIQKAAGLTDQAQRDYQNNSKINIDEYTPAANADLKERNEFILELNISRLIVAMRDAIQGSPGTEYTAIETPGKQFTMHGFRAVTTRVTTASLTASLDGQAAAAAGSSQQTTAPTTLQPPVSPFGVTLKSRPQPSATEESTSRGDQTPPAAAKLTGTAAAFARFGATMRTTAASNGQQSSTPPSGTPKPGQ